MKKIKLTLMMLAISLLSSCSGKNSRLAPDEFSVINNTPLSIPPFYQIENPESNNHNFFINNNKSKNVIIPTSQGDKLILDKIAIQNDDVKSILMEKNKSTGKSFFNKIFKKENSYAKDSTQDPAADESIRTYKSESMPLMKTGPKNNGRICNISNGEVIYCDKNTFIKNFTFQAN